MCNNISNRSRILLENNILGSYMKYITKLIFFSISCLIFSNLLSKDITNEKFTTDDIYKIKNIHSLQMSKEDKKVQRFLSSNLLKKLLIYNRNNFTDVTLSNGTSCEASENASPILLSSSMVSMLKKVS